MSDLAAAQREARRRKITQNAHARMNKLMGRHDLADMEQTESNIITPHFSRAPNPPREENQAEPQSLPQSHPSPYNLRRRHQRSDSPAAAVTKRTVAETTVSTETAAPEAAVRAPDLEEITHYHVPPSNMQLKHEMPSATDESSDTADPLVNYEPSIRFPTTRHDMPTSTTQLKDDRSVTSDESEDMIAPVVNNEPRTHSSTTTRAETQHNLNTFDEKSLEVFRIVVCVVTSFISRSALGFGFGLFMVESIFLPFFAMEIFFTCILEVNMKEYIKVQNQGSLVSAALMLCGIKPELMGVYYKIMSHITMVTSDFSVYLFSFIIWNSVF